MSNPLLTQLATLDTCTHSSTHSASTCIYYLYPHREFDLVLKPETRFFHENLTLIIDGKKASSHLAKYHVYSGTDRSECIMVHSTLYSMPKLGRLYSCMHFCFAGLLANLPSSKASESVLIVKGFLFSVRTIPYVILLSRHLVQQVIWLLCIMYK